ncbi:MAG: ABC transporter permease [Bdellovibrionales bacterium]|nr:ABC transporter permease [Bdellovibrionales bacterium]
MGLILELTGRKFLRFLYGYYEMSIFLKDTVRIYWRDKDLGSKSIFKVIAEQVYFTGFQALPIVFVLAVFCSLAVTMQAKLQMNFWGDSNLTGVLFDTIILREVSTLLPAILLIARSGTAVASELASMKLNKEVDALWSMGIHPYSYIVFPRLVGGVASLLALSIYFNLFAIIFGSIFAILFMGMDFSYFINQIFYQIRSGDISVFFIKNILSGCIIFLVSSQQGLSLKLSSHEIPQVTMMAVMKCISMVLFTHILCSVVFYWVVYG